jgi:PAS domain S-box-containing protein
MSSFHPEGKPSAPALPPAGRHGRKPNRPTPVPHVPPAELLRAIVETSPVATMAFDRDRKLTFWSGGAERVFGWSADEVLGGTLPPESTPESERVSAAERIDRTMAGAIITGELVHRRARDGHDLTLEIYAAALRNEAGEPIGFGGQMIDVTERQRSRAEFDRLVAAVGQTVDGVVISDRDGVITYVNPAYERQSGYPASELVGRHHASFVGDIVEATVYADMSDAGRNGRPWFGEVVQRRRDGSSSLVQLSLTPVRDENGEISSFVAVQRDITDLRAMEADLALEAGFRHVLGATIQAIAPASTLEQAAQTICDELTTLPGVDFTAVGAFLGSDDAVLLASQAPVDFPLRVGDHLPAHRARRLWTRAADGPWAEPWASTVEDGEWGAQLDRVGLKAFAFGPIVHGDHVDGGVVIGTRDAAFARTLVEKMPSIVDFSTTPSALLAERLHAHRAAIELRSSIATAIADRAFHPVFQPIVELRSGEVVGYEALTRFDSGQRPDRAFAAAHDMGLGYELELATLEAAIEGSHGLPSGRWLDLNVSPSLVARTDALRSLVHRAGRPIVLEITEHDIVADYPALREAVRALGGDVRLAVDDAGAGIANFGHIVELRAHFVKLDITMVRGVNVSLGRQALVVAMSYFARTAGCRLVAEGIETEDEARALTELGVEFGQGYWFGRPEPAAVTREGAGVRPARRLSDRVALSSQDPRTDD